MVSYNVVLAAAPRPYKHVKKHTLAALSDTGNLGLQLQPEQTLVVNLNP